MGRNKIKIEKIANERNRQVTFYKRKRGLLKKAMEIALLCEVKVMLCIVDKNEKAVLYSSENLGSFLQKYVKKSVETGNYLKTENYHRLFKKGKKGKKSEKEEEEEEMASSEDQLEIINTPRNSQLSGTKFSIFQKSENCYEISEDLLRPNKGELLNNIMEELSKRKVDEISKPALSHTGKSSRNASLRCDSPHRSIYSAPSIHNSESLIDINKSAISVENALLKKKRHHSSKGTSSEGSLINDSLVETSGGTVNEVENSHLNSSNSISSLLKKKTNSNNVKSSFFKKNAEKEVEKTAANENLLFGLNSQYNPYFGYMNQNSNQANPSLFSFFNNLQNSQTPQNNNNDSNFSSNYPLNLAYQSQLAQLYNNQAEAWLNLQKDVPANSIPNTSNINSFTGFTYEHYFNLLTSRVLNESGVTLDGNSTDKSNYKYLTSFLNNGFNDMCNSNQSQNLNGDK